MNTLKVYHVYWTDRSSWNSGVDVDGNYWSTPQRHSQIMYGYSKAHIRAQVRAAYPASAQVQVKPLTPQINGVLRQKPGR